MLSPRLTEAAIRNVTSEKSFRRGKEYYEAGAVSDLTRRGNILQAEVEGSHYEPYRVTIRLDAGGVVEATCTCPYREGGYCKHIVAVLLTYVHKPHAVVERPSVEDLLAGLSREELRELLGQLLSDHPHLMDWVEVRLAAKIKSAPPNAKGKPYRRRTTLDASSFRRQARHIMMHPPEAYWATGGMVDELRSLVHQARPFIEAGDGRNALVILEAVTEVYIEQWTDLDDSDGELGGFFDELGLLFAEAILSADLSRDERKEWMKKLRGWQEAIEDYGIDNGFRVAIAAARQGWDDPRLQRILRGHVPQKRGWEPVPDYAKDLTLIRLHILERQGRTAEYLHLAQAEGQAVQYATMLVKVGRWQEAVEYGLRYLATPDEALELARTLREHDRPLEALRVAKHGLTLGGDLCELARWLREFAFGLGQIEVARKAARAAFVDSLALEDYQAAQVIAGADWPAVKAEFLKRLDASPWAPDKVDIYLYEGMIESAMRVVDEASYVGLDAVERVVDAAWQSHPEWVIRQCRKQAEPIMDEGKSQYYHHAVRWLEKARRAYLALGQAAQWNEYLEGLIRKHARKYALRPRLEALRI